MSLTVENLGDRNEILLPSEGNDRLAGRIMIHGDNNRCEIGAGSFSNGIYVTLASGSNLRIGRGCSLGNLFIYLATGAELLIGDGCIITGLVRFLLHEPRRIIVGAGCLFAAEVDVTVSDMHSIVDAENGERINPARDITIEDRVWIGQRGMILKGTHIGAGSVIGACSVVTGSIPGNSIAVGSPARVIRNGVTWRMDLI